MIEREEHEWGVRLTTHPFAGMKYNSEMLIQAEVRGKTIKIWFSWTVVQHALKRPDAITWMTHMRAIFDAAQVESCR